MAKAKPRRRKFNKRGYPNIPPARIFVGIAIPGEFWIKELAETGRMEFVPLGRSQPVDGDEQGRPNYRHRTFTVIMTDGTRRFTLGYVWMQTGSQFWKARQPNGPWRGSFATRKSAGNALRRAFVPNLKGV